MNIIHLINNDAYKKRFGMVVRMLRTRHRHTLRSLADLAGFSHAYLRKIEFGKPPVAHPMYERIMTALRHDIKYDPTLETKFFEAWEAFNRAVIAFDRSAVETAYNTIMEDSAFHKQSLWLAEYNIIQLGYIFHTLHMDIELSSQLQDELLSIESLLEPEVKQIYYVFMGNYYFLLEDPINNTQILDKLLEMDAETAYKAMAYYQVGLAYSMTFSLKKANKHFLMALEMFKTMSNHIRVEHLNAYIEMNNVKMNELDNAMEVFDRAIEMAERHGMNEFLDEVLFHCAVYHLKCDAPLKALEKLFRISGYSYRYYFLRAYAQCLANDMNAFRLSLNETKRLSSSIQPSELMYHYGIEVLAHWHFNDDAKLETVCKSFFNECMRSKGYYEIDIAYDFYKRTLMKKRKYKLAYELSNRMIAMTKTAFD